MKSNIKRCIALMCAICMLAGMSACESSDGNGSSDVTSSSSDSSSVTQSTNDKMYLTNNESDKLAEVNSTLNAKEIYSNLTYTPQMFYGCYALNGGYEFPCASEEISKYIEEMDYWESKNVYSTLEQDVTKIPFRMEAGQCTLSNPITRVTKYQWMCMYYQTATGQVANVLGAYEVSGDTLSFFPLSEYEYNEDTDELKYTVSEKSIDYKFSFNGANLTLSLDDKSVTMTARGLADGYDSLFVNNYLTSKSSRIGDIEMFDIYSSIDSDMEHFNIMLNNDNMITNAVGEFSNDGLFTFSWKNSDGSEKSYQYVYFFCENDGLVLTDGKTNYFYNDSASMRNQSLLGGSLSSKDIEKLETIDEEQLAIIIEKRTNLLTDLEEAFTKEGIDVEIDEETGEIMLDSTILFGFDETELSSDGKKFLSKFLKAYSSVILRDDYKGFVSKILVEGHTDSTGDYDYNKTLSQKRADNVKNYCLSEKAGLDSKVTSDLKKLMQAVGCASDNPVFDKNGKEDEDASRRVSFRFNINLDD